MAPLQLNGKRSQVEPGDVVKVSTEVTDAEGNAHEECVIDADGEGREFAWCATRVDGQVRFFKPGTFLKNK